MTNVSHLFKKVAGQACDRVAFAVPNKQTCLSPPLGSEASRCTLRIQTRTWSYLPCQWHVASNIALTCQKFCVCQIRPCPNNRLREQENSSKLEQAEILMCIVEYSGACMIFKIPCGKGSPMAA